jgi:hypothetical protein
MWFLEDSIRFHPAEMYVKPDLMVKGKMSYADVQAIATAPICGKRKESVNDRGGTGKPVHTQ